jgi:hypothetical protein
MKKFFKRLQKADMGLLVSLPRNDAELARAAVDGGADALKVHINVRHAASGTQFGSFNEEKDRIAAIIDAGIPVGIMPGADTVATLDEMRAMHDMGVQFYDIYLRDLPTAYLDLRDIEGMPALGEGFDPASVGAVAEWGFRLLEASFVAHGDYGRPLAVDDLLRYAAVCNAFSGVVVVPTQKAIRPADVPRLVEAGVRSLMIGKIVSGDTPSSIRAATESFRRAIDALR